MANKNPPKPGTDLKSQQKRVANNLGLTDKQLGSLQTSLGHIARTVNTRMSGTVSLAVKEAILKENAKGDSYLAQYIDNLLKEAKKDPNSRASQLVANAMGIDSGFLDRAEKFINQQQQQDEDFRVWRIRKLLHPLQQEIFDDTNPYKILMLGRRAGKTEVCAAKLVQRAGLENQPCLVIHKQLEAAIFQYWTPIQEISTKSGIELSRKDKGNGRLEFPGGGYIQFHSNDNKPNIDKIRGYHYHTVVMDECFFHGGSLKYAIESILEMAMSQHAGHQLILSSTPPVSKVRYYESILDTWKVYHGTVLDNPFIPAAHDEFRKMQAERGDTTTFKREWLGERVFDEEAICFHPIFSDEKPYGITSAMMGADLGWNDDTALVSIAVNNTVKKAWLIFEENWNEEGSQETTRRFKDQYARFKEWLAQHGLPNYNPYIQADHNEKLTTYDMKQLQGLPIEMAYKLDWNMSISHLQDAFKLGKLIIQKDGLIADECLSTIWARSKETDQLLSEWDKSFHPNGIPAVQYAWNRICFDDPGMM